MSLELMLGMAARAALHAAIRVALGTSSRERCMRVLCAAAVIALLAGPAYAQQKSVPRYGEAPAEKTRSEIEQDRTAERAYKRSLGNIPDQTPSDPWGNARSVDAPKAVAKPSPAKPRTKTGATAN
jgi:hypothetical protein